MIATGAGRPLRFLAIVLSGWIGARSYALYREGGVAALPLVPAIVRAIVPSVAAAPVRLASGRVAVRQGAIRIGTDRGSTPMTAAPPKVIAPMVVAATGTGLVAIALPSSMSVRPALPVVAPEARVPPIARGASRLAGSAWLIARGGTTSAAAGGQLGGSQAGVRLTYAIGHARRLAVSARLTSPLAGPGREAAVGFDWQPTRLPLHLVAERRIALDGGRGGPIVGVVGGFGPARVAGAVTLEGYGQAGVIDRDRAEPFADGAVRAALPVAHYGRLRIDIGAGAWGGAQRTAARLDIGPTLGIALPVGGRSLRLAADWRQRIAGDARPGSGPALSIGTDF